MIQETRWAHGKKDSLFDLDTLLGCKRSGGFKPKAIKIQEKTNSSWELKMKSRCTHYESQKTITGSIYFKRK